MNLSEIEQQENLPTNPKGVSCDSCGEKFEKPLFTTMASGQVLKEYYACPKCLSKIISVDVQKPKEEIKPEVITKEDQKIEQNKTSIPGCKNTLGYLKRRPKTAPIPEECFTCNKMIDCMAH